MGERYETTDGGLSSVVSETETSSSGERLLSPFLALAHFGSSPKSKHQFVPANCTWVSPLSITQFCNPLNDPPEPKHGATPTLVP